MTKHEVSPENAERYREWFAIRGGLAVWGSVNLSNPGASWTTPRLATDGTPMQKPTWEAGVQPIRIITDPSEVVVVTAREVKRFHIAVRRGRGGFLFKLTDASTRKVREAVKKAGERAWYQFDYGTQEVVIYVADGVQPLM